MYENGSRVPHLHSTMFLLIQIGDRADIVDDGFTFHYVSTYTGRVQLCVARLLLIYIPLYFYLYRNSGRKSGRLFSFTFHYVSTYTNFNRDHTLVIDNIYIPLCFYLYSSTGIQPSFMCLIYIPLCFYLYGISLIPISNPVSASTFHYVSTYTCGVS